MEHEIVKDLVLINNSSFPARYGLVPQEESTSASLLFTSESPAGTIEPYSTTSIPLRIFVRRLGIMSINALVNIIGNANKPLSFDLLAVGIGPDVKISVTELDWEKIDVLKPTERYLVLNNTSPVMAFFNCALPDISVFTVEPRMGVINPFGEIRVTLTAFLDDIIKFIEVLKIHIQQTRSLDVRLIARGQGTTLLFNDGLKHISFGDVFSRCECEAEFTVLNKGRRMQSISWASEEISKSIRDLRVDQVFEVIPNRFNLAPNASQTIIVKGVSLVSRFVDEKLSCFSVLGHDTLRRILFESKVTANFIDPIVLICPTSLNFVAAHCSEIAFSMATKELRLRNNTSLRIHISINCPLPFRLSQPVSKHSLHPGEEMNLTVGVDNDYDRTRVTCADSAKLKIFYCEHAQVDFVMLKSEVNFPNLGFSDKFLKFSIYSEVEQTKTLQLTNQGCVAVKYQWYFKENSKSSQIVSNRAFDIQPDRKSVV